jgi:hypothetical protein
MLVASPPIAEKIAHLHFDQYKIHGEWFDAPKAVIDGYISELVVAQTE